MTATAAPTTPTIPAWVTPGAPVVIFFATVGITAPMAIEQGVIDNVTPFVITLTNGAKFDMATQTEIGEDFPCQTRIADPASDTTRLLMDRFNKKVAMDEFNFGAMLFKANPTPERAQAIINALQTFI